MRLIVASEADEASVAIRQALLVHGRWREEGNFRGLAVHRSGEDILVSMPDLHLDVDDLDRVVQAELGVHPTLVVYVSKHASEAARRSFTVHPIGNWHGADFGGRPAALVPSAPGAMAAALRGLHRWAPPEGYEVTFEATHHGPYLSTPTFFIEVGSDLTAWRDPRNAETIARALAGAPVGDERILVGVGGGHYVPRMTDLVLRRRVAVGHMVPGYALKEPIEPLLRRAIDATPGASGVYIHRKALDNAVVRAVEEWCGGEGLPVVREGDLPALGPA